MTEKDAERNSRDEAPESGREEAASADGVAEGVARVLDAAVGVGASMAKAVAEATGGEEGVSPPPGGRPADALVHYGVAAVTNVVGRVVSAVEGGAPGGGGRAAGTGAGASRGAPAEGGEGPGTELPAVRAGASLRVPISIENPATEPMEQVRIVCSEVRSHTADGQGPECEHLRFEPEELDVAARDFEKLTVYVDVPAEAAPGVYEAVLLIGSPDAPTSLVFRVLDGGS